MFRTCLGHAAVLFDHSSIQIRPLIHLISAMTVKMHRHNAQVLKKLSPVTYRQKRHH